MKDAEIRKVFRIGLKMEKEAAKDNPQLSKNAHQAFKYVTGSVSKGDGLGDIATWTTPSGTKVARGHKAVGAVVSEYTHSISSAGTAEGMLGWWSLGALQCMMPCWFCTRRCGEAPRTLHGMRLGYPTSTRRGARLRSPTTGLSH